MKSRKLLHSVSGDDRLEAPSTSGAKMQKFFTITDIAEMLGVSTRTVHRWIAARDLVVHRLGSAVRIAEADLKVFLALHRED